MKYDCRQRLAMQAVLSDTERIPVLASLREMPGIESAGWVSGRLEIRYRLPEACLERICARLAVLGWPPSQAWWHRLARAVAMYSEDCRLPALEAERRPPKPCCNRPPK